MVIFPERKEARNYDLTTELLIVKESVKSHFNLVNFCFSHFLEGKKKKQQNCAYMIYNKESCFFKMSADTFQVNPERVT